MPSKGLAYLLTFLVALTWPLFFPQLKVMYFAPLLIIIFYQCSLAAALWQATLVGVVCDLLGGGAFPLTACNYTLTALLIYRFRRHFFEDGLFTLFIMTFLFSSLSGVLGFIFLKVLGQGFPLTAPFIMTDFFLLPLLDGLFAFLIYTLGLGFFNRRRKIEE